MRPIVLLSFLALAACGSSASTSDSSVTATTTATSPVDTADDGTVTTDNGTPISDDIVNVWIAGPTDPTALPIGTSHVTTTDPAADSLYVCDAGVANAPGAFAVGPWIDESAGTWDKTQKISVEGSVDWPMAQYSEVVDGDSRTIESNGIPVGSVTGVFPIAADDPAYDYDRNPNTIAESAINVTLPVSPTVAPNPSCLPKGSIGVLKNGVALFAPIDAGNRDAVAYEVQDVCDGHPQQDSMYHYHDIPSCIQDASTGASTVVGFAYDGFPIVVERDAAGNLPTNADLDECHGRSSPINLDGAVVEMYHYSATLEFPYFIGCYRGEPI